MASTFQNRSDWITQTRQASTKILDGLNELRSLKEAYDAGISVWLIDATGSDPTVEDYEPHDFAGANEGLIKADMTDVIGTTLTALEGIMATGNETNLEKVRS